MLYGDVVHLCSTMQGMKGFYKEEVREYTSQKRLVKEHFVDIFLVELICDPVSVGSSYTASQLSSNTDKTYLLFKTVDGHAWHVQPAAP